MDRREEGRSESGCFIETFFADLINKRNKDDSEEGRESAQGEFAAAGGGSPSRKKEVIERRVNIGGGTRHDSIRALKSHLIAVAFVVPQRLRVNAVKTEEGC
jgi:hypothetical protein